MLLFDFINLLTCFGWLCSAFFCAGYNFINASADEIEINRFRANICFNLNKASASVVSMPDKDDHALPLFGSVFLSR